VEAGEAVNIEVPNNDEPSMNEKLQEVLFTLATRRRNKFTYAQHVDRWTKEEEVHIPQINIPDSKLFLGFSSLDYQPENVVAPPINIVSEEGGRIVPKARVITIIGRKGSGKSVLASIIAQDNIQRKFGVPTLFIDPNPTPEWHIHKNPLTHRFKSPDMLRRLREYAYKFNVEFRGYTTKCFRPAFDSSFKEEGVDADLTLSLSDFKQMYDWSKLDAMQSILEVLELTDNHVAERAAAQILAYPNFKTFGQVISSIEGRTAFKHDQELKSIGSAFASDLRTAILLNVLNDKEKAESDSVVDDMLNYNSVVLRSKMKTEGDKKMMAKYFVYTKLVLTQVLSDRIKFSSGAAEARATAKLTHPIGITIVPDEADTLCPEGDNTYLKKTIEEIATKYRKAGVSLIPITQNAALLSHVLLAQSDLIICSKIDSTGNARALKERGVSDQAIGIMRHLKVEQTNSLGFKVNEWCVIDQQNRCFSFYPAVPLSEFKI
jgi:hypothetical protein